MDLDCLQAAVGAFAPASATPPSVVAHAGQTSSFQMTTGPSGPADCSTSKISLFNGLAGALSEHTGALMLASLAKP
jgi:hypothetical protein